MNHAPHSTVIPRYAVATADSEVDFSPYLNLTVLAFITTIFACAARGSLRAADRSLGLAVRARDSSRLGASARTDWEILECFAQGYGLAC